MTPRNCTSGSSTIQWFAADFIAASAFSGSVPSFGIASCASVATRAINVSPIGYFSLVGDRALLRASASPAAHSRPSR